MKTILRIMVLCLLFSGSNCLAGHIQTSPGPELQVTGEETWVDQGEKYEIDGTMLVRLTPFPNHIYAIRVLISESPGGQHESFARAVAKYAFDNGYLDKAKKVSFNGSPVVLVPKIGVAVIKRTGPSFLNYAEGYRFQFNIEEFK